MIFRALPASQDPITPCCQTSTQRTLFMRSSRGMNHFPTPAGPPVIAYLQIRQCSSCHAANFTISSTASHRASRIKLCISTAPRGFHKSILLCYCATRTSNAHCQKYEPFPCLSWSSWESILLNSS